MLPQPGDSAPWFVARTSSNPQYHFHTVAGRLVVLCFVASAADTHARAVLEAFSGQPALFDDQRACFFAITCDPDDETSGRLKDAVPGYRVFWDFDRRVSELYGVTAASPCSVMLDERLRVLASLPYDPARGARRHAAAVLHAATQYVLKSRENPPRAPVLVVPRVFEPAFCRRLIDYYQSGAARPSGFMQERDGLTVAAFDDAFKRRTDCGIEDEALRAACRSRLVNRLKPEIHRAFQFVATYAERYIVACYSSAEQGFFRPHRDNTTKGTAHRRFAVTINLNTGGYEGGLLRFPEYGGRTFEAPLGGAVVFSCSLMHEATPVTRGERYAFLPFLYDEAAAKLSEANMAFVAGEASSALNPK